jgi:radical SAM superfamily enzyme YgiQ (UPF0313 family)
MKILIIYPYCLEDRLSEEDIRVVPIGAYYVGAMLKENHYDVEILNWHDMKEKPEKIKEALLEKNAEVIGFSILHANRWGGIEIAKIAKQVNPNVKIVFGGIGATLLWDHLLKNFKEIDFVVMGEGEHTFLHLIKCIESKHFNNLKKIKGIAYRKGTACIKTTPGELIEDLDTLPMPAKYFEYQHVSATRGCPENCVFCGSPQLWGRRVRFHSAKYFVDQLEMLYEKGIAFFYFSDDTFTINKSLVKEICEKIIEKKWKTFWVAISNVKYVKEEILPWMRKAGCIQISYGVESGSDKIRRRLNKKVTAHQIQKAFDLTRKYGILPRAYFIYGSPGENWGTIQQTIDLINEIKPLGAIFYILDIFPGTSLYSELKQKQNIADDIWLKRIEDIMYFETDPQMSSDLILAFGQKLRNSFYENLPRFVQSVELVDKKEFYALHADFLSRIGLTFSHGDYARIDSIKGKDAIAEKLFRQALDYHPDHRAYLGLAIIKQKGRQHDDAIKILSEGIEYFPESQDLHICQGINHMNLGDFSKALSYFLKFEDSKESQYYIAGCYKAMGDMQKSKTYLDKYNGK